MALGTLGRSHTVVWWLPSTADPLQFDQGAEVGITDLVPSWVRWALLQVVLAVAVVVWWRGRRLGRVVVEPLPVVVRATESVEGRARLYRRGRARGSAADAMRTASLTRLRARLGLPRSAPADVVVAAVSRPHRPTRDRDRGTPHPRGHPRRRREPDRARGRARRTGERGPPLMTDTPGLAPDPMPPSPDEVVGVRGDRSTRTTTPTSTRGARPAGRAARAAHRGRQGRRRAGLRRDRSRHRAALPRARAARGRPGHREDPA